MMDLCPPSKTDALKTCAKRMEGLDPIAVKEHLLSFDNEKKMVNRVLEGKEDGDGDKKDGEDVVDVGKGDEPHDGGTVGGWGWGGLRSIMC